MENKIYPINVRLLNQILIKIIYIEQKNIST